MELERSWPGGIPRVAGGRRRRSSTGYHCGRKIENKLLHSTGAIVFATSVDRARWGRREGGPRGSSGCRGGGGVGTELAEGVNGGLMGRAEGWWVLCRNPRRKRRGEEGTDYLGRKQGAGNGRRRRERGSWWRRIFPPPVDPFLTGGPPPPAILRSLHQSHSL